MACTGIEAAEAVSGSCVLSYTAACGDHCVLPLANGAGKGISERPLSGKSVKLSDDET